MRPEDRLRDMLRADGDAHEPGDGRDGIARRLRSRRRARLARRVAIPVIAAGIVAAIAVPQLTSSPRPTQNVATGGSTTSTGDTTSVPSSTSEPGATTGTSVPSAITDAPTTTTLPGGHTLVLSGIVVDQQGHPVAGAALISNFTKQVMRTDATGAFTITCIDQPNDGSTDADMLWAASWLPNMYYNPGGAADPMQDPAPADPSVGWTYVNAVNAFVDSWTAAPLCAQLLSPIRVVLPAAGSLHITGDWPAGTPVSLYWPGLDANAAAGVTGDPSYGTDPPGVMISSYSPVMEAPRAWTEPATAGGVTFPALSPTGYSVWVGDELASDCANLQVTAGQTTDATCTLASPTTTTAPPSTTTAGQ